MNVQLIGAPIAPVVPGVVPMIYHGAKRSLALDVPAAAVKLGQLFDKRSGRPRFENRESLLQAFRLAAGTQVIVSGVDKDPVVERWWDIGAAARQAIIGRLIELGVGLVTTPNFSLCVDWPRESDLNAMKRIGLCLAEFMNAGLPAALHVNGRTEWDFARWVKFINAHAGITHVSYEFTTGAAHGELRARHVGWLRGLAAEAARPLTLVAYGESAAAVELARDYAEVVWMDTTSFMRTVKRCVAERQGNAELIWPVRKTEPDEMLDARLAWNIGEQRTWYEARKATALERA